MKPSSVTGQVVIGSDHAGYELKQHLKLWLRHEKYRVLDVGTDSLRPVDYPDYAEAVGLRVTQSPAARGILICGSGVGAAIAANKIPGVRAGLCHDSYSAHQGVEHDAMNVLVLGARVIGGALAQDLCSDYLRACFDGVARHARRVQKIEALESKYFELSFTHQIA